MLTYSLVQQHRWHQSKGPYRSDIYGTSLLWRTSEGFKAWKLGQLDSQYHGLKLKRKSWVEIQYLIDTQSFLQTIEWKLGIPSQETRSKATDQLLGTMARKLCRYSNLSVNIDSQNHRRCWWDLPLQTWWLDGAILTRITGRIAGVRMLDWTRQVL